MSYSIYHLLSRNVIGKQNVWVGQFDNSWTECSVSIWVVLAKCTVYPSKQVGRKGALTPNSKCESELEMHSVSIKTGWTKECTDPPSQNLIYGSKSHQFDIAGGVAHSSSEILVLLVRDVKMGLGSWNYWWYWYDCHAFQCPWGSCQVWYCDEWSFLSGYVQWWWRSWYFS